MGAQAEPSSEGKRTQLLPVGELVAGRYRIVAVLGEGATSVVYVATKEGTGERVALKVIHRHLLGDPQVSKRFRREARILAHVTGEHVVRLRDVVEHEGLVALALDLAPGRSLESRLAKGPLPVDEAVELASQVTLALESAHEAGVIHRDLKPANVLVEERDGALFARVVDFGLAKAVHGDAVTTGLTEHDMICGTPDYMAPEQIRGEDLTPRVDVYAAGVMLYRMLTGKLPFTGKTPVAAMTAHLTARIEPPRAARPDRQIPPAVEAVVLRALARDPADRYGSARELGQALAAVGARATVAPSSGERTTDLALGATDLDHALSRSDIAQRPTLPAPAAQSSSVTRRDAGGRAFLVVVLVACLAGIALGAWLGLR